MDALSDVLSLLKPRSYSCAGFDLGEHHCIRVPAYEGIFCYAIVTGQLWLSLSNGPADLLLQAGDCVILPTGRAFTVTTTPGTPPIDIEVVLRNQPIQSVTTYHGGGKCFMIGCHFALEGNHSHILLDLLSPVVHIRETQDKSTLHWALDCMRQELHDPRAGSSLIVQYVAQLVLVKGLRSHLSADGVGWLFALSDSRLNTAITALHADPAYRWTLDLLAQQAGMSRTRFAVRFKQAVGVSPLDYLRRWRMLLAANRLTTTDEPVFAIALSLGYDSESAFSAAFKRVMEVAPRRYRQGCDL